MKTKSAVRANNLSYKYACMTPDRNGNIPDYNVMQIIESKRGL